MEYTTEKYLKFILELNENENLMMCQYYTCTQIQALMVF